MKQHKWKRIEVDGGNLGVDEFWECEDCGAAGGPVSYKTDPPTKEDNWVFLAGGSGLQLPLDCDESKEIIAKHKETYGKMG